MAKFIPITKGTIFNNDCKVTSLNKVTFNYINHKGKADYMSYAYWKRFAEIKNGKICVKYYNRGELVSYTLSKTFFKLDQ